MKILVTGRGTSGSWAIRGAQLGKAIGATVEANAVISKGYDLAILVKRCDDRLIERLRGVPVVWDVVDAWTQPMGNHWDKEAALTWLRGQVRRIRPKAIVAATQQMAADCAEFDLPVICIPHHARPGQELNPIRERVHKVGYQGGEKHLGCWRQIVEKQCAARRWKFVLNPQTLAEVDIVVALREATGYPARFWKSGVKAANAQASGTPCILSPEAGYLENQSGAECFAENEQGLAASFDRLEDYRERSQSSRTLQLSTPHLSTVAARYRSWLEALRF